MLNLLLSLAVSASSGLMADQARGDSLRARIDSIVASVPGAEVAVAYVDLHSRDTLYRGADVAFHAASTMKIPVMMEVLRSAEAGRLRLEQQVLVINRFSSIVDGSAYALDATEDGDTTLYGFIGQRVTVGELNRRMIVRSSNLATNTLIALVGADHVRAMARDLGAKNTNVLRGVEDQKAFDAGMINTITARDLAILLAAVETGLGVSPAAGAEMRTMLGSVGVDPKRAVLSRQSVVLLRQTLAAQEFNEKIPAGLPPGTPVAHKTGEITAVSHDAAIVYPPGRPPYILVVLTRGIPDGSRSARLIADVSRVVWAHATARSAQL